MPLYEHVFLARQDMSGQQVEALVEQMKGVITAGGGTVSKVEAWGLKSISFRIRKNRKAHYNLLNIDAPPAAVAEMERLLGINEDVLRYMTVRVDVHETEPSAMMQKRDRGDRDDRGPRGDRPFGRDRGDRGDRGPRSDRPRRDDDGASSGREMN